MKWPLLKLKLQRNILEVIIVSYCYAVTSFLMDAWQCPHKDKASVEARLVKESLAELTNEII